MKSFFRFSDHDITLNHPITCEKTKEVCGSLSEYFSSHHWKTIVSKKFSNPKNCICFLCLSSSKSLTLYFRSIKRLGNEHLNDLLPMCADCISRIRRELNNNKSTRVNRWNIVNRHRNNAISKKEKKLTNDFLGKKKRLSAALVSQSDLKMERVIYVLLLEGDKYYIGQTTAAKKRLMQHFNQSPKAAQWTKKYKPIEIIDELNMVDCTYKEAEVIENETTLKYMRLKGWKNVRGGFFCNISEEIVCRSLKNSKRKGFEIDFL